MHPTWLLVILGNVIYVSVGAPVVIGSRNVPLGVEKRWQHVLSRGGFVQLRTR